MRQIQTHPWRFMVQQNEMTIDTFKGVIMVGGPSVGTRFRPLSLNMPKPLFPIAGDAMISHHVRALNEVSGMKEILLIGFFESSVFEKLIKETESKVPIKYLREYQALGTAGCLFHFRDEIQRGSPTKIFVTNADICCSFPLDKMIQFHASHNATATLLSIPMDRSEVHRYGCVVVDKDTQKVAHFVEKPESFISDLISCGVYLFDNSIFDKVKEVIGRVHQLAVEEGFGGEGNQKVRLEQDVLAHLASIDQLHTFVLDTEVDFWRQIKTGSSVIPANKLYLSHFQKMHPRRLSVAQNTGGPFLIQPVLIHPTANVDPSAKIGPNVWIGPKVTIARGARVRDSVILDNVEIGHDACVLNAVVGWDGKIGGWARVEGSPEDATHLNATYKGLKIPTATVMGAGVSVGDEVVIRNCIVLPYKELKYSYHNEVLM